MKPELYKFQKEDLKKWIRNGHRGIFGWDMGTGKTYVGARVVAVHAKLDERILIIAPISLINDWTENCEDNGVTVTDIRGKNIDKQTDQVCIINYAQLHKVTADYDLIIADEAHKIKSYSSNRGKAAKNLCNKADKVLLMSGTLSQFRDSQELINYLWCLNTPSIQAKIPDKITHFRKKYCTLAGNDMRKWPVTTREGAEIVSDLLHEHTSFRERSEVLDLPPYIEKVIRVDVGDVWEKKIKQLQQEMNLTIDSAYEKPHLAHAMQMANGIDFETNELVHRGKIDTILELLEDIRETEPVIIWTWWRNFTEILAKELEDKYPGQIGLIMGGTNDKEKVLLDFKSKKKRIIVATQGTISEGHNFQFCRYSIYANVYYDITKFEQSKARIYRNGQDRTTFNYIITGKGTIETDVLYTLRTKLELKEAQDYLNTLMGKRYGV